MLDNTVNGKDLNFKDIKLDAAAKAIMEDFINKLNSKGVTIFGDSCTEADMTYSDPSIYWRDTCQLLKPEIVDISESHNFLTLTSTARVIKGQDEWGSSFLAEEAKKLGHTKQPDLLYIEHKLVHANVNKNRDEFKLEELELSEKTPILKLVNWEHTEENIGTIFASKLITDPENEFEDSYLLVGTAISKAKYPERAKEIVERYEAGKLYFSMETYFKAAECSVCGQKFAGGSHTYCDHLQKRFSEGSQASRVLRGLTFAGDAIVENPADINAESLAIAKIQKPQIKKETNDNSLLIKETKQPSKEEIVVATKETWTNEELDLEVEKRVQTKLEEMSLSELKTDFDVLKVENASMVEKINELTSLLEETVKALSEKDEAYAGIEQEYTEFKTVIANKELVRSRVKDLAKIGYTVPSEDESELFDAFAQKLLGMDDNAFELMKELVSEAIKNSISTEESNDETSASADNADENDHDEDTLPIGSANADVSDTFETKLNRILGGILTPQN